MPALLTKSLGVVCPSCDFLNVVAAVRCMACGSATEGAASARTDVAPKLQAPEISNTAANDATTPSSPVPAAAPPGLKRSTSTTTTPMPQPQPQPTRGPPTRPTFQSSAPTQTTPQVAAPKFGLTVLAGPARGQRFRLAATGAQVGRAKGAILFPDDPFISPLHATLSIRDGKLYVKDESSTSGVYVSINSTETIPANGTFCTGLRLFRFVGAVEPAEPWNKVDVLVYGATVPNGQIHYAVEEVMLGDRGGRCLLSPGPVLTVGQGRCDFSYPNDEGLAPRHCEISPLPDGAMIRDLSGGLGTYVRVTGERPIKAGDRMRVGQQTLQVEALS
ncbi:MAG: FHA domain-containing protein [Archangium sp.]|nr:FHA domain-containing protein [Archangium sp.]MDP3570883.1 FHA domain-containing protein [Archangium sp.]